MRLARPRSGERDVLELEAEIFRDGLAARELREVGEHFLAAITEARRLDGRDVQRAAELVHDERGECFAVDVFRDDEERLARLRHLLERGEQILHRRDLLLVDEDVRVLEDDFHALRVRHEVRREVAAIELHALDDVERGLHRLCFFDGDDAFLADLLHGLGDHVADRRVAVRGDGADLRDLGLALGGRRELLEVGDDGFSTAASMPRFTSIGFAPAATIFAPSV